MGQGFPLECNVCKAKREPSGPWEFFRNQDGEMEDYGHPEPKSKEAEEAGIHGFYAEMYCMHCGDLRNVILEEYEQPVNSALELLTGDKQPTIKYRNEDDPACPVCSKRGLVLRPEPLADIPCPQCDDGQLQLVGSWIS
jgi:hypothetical protein